MNRQSLNRAIGLAMANNNGFTVNLSANNLSEADSLKALNIGPVVTVLPREAPQDRYTRLALERMGAW